MARDMTKLTIRVRPTRVMKLYQLRLLVDRALTEGTIPPGLRIDWMDWQRGTSGHLSEGTITRDMQTALRKFRTMLQAPGLHTRFARVRQ